MPNTYLPPVIQTPSALEIASISQSMPMQVIAVAQNDTTQINTYIPGMAVRLFIPYSYGMYQANNLVGTIIDVDVDTFTIAIDSTKFDPFVIPLGSAEAPASIAPAGSRNLQYNNSNSNKVAFKSYNNIGN